MTDRPVRIWVRKRAFWRECHYPSVGSHDCSYLAENMEWQVMAVGRVLTQSSSDPMPPITPVLCFLRAEWPLLGRPSRFGHVTLADLGRHLLAGPPVLDPPAVERLTHTLATELPPA